MLFLILVCLPLLSLLSLLLLVLLSLPLWSIRAAHRGNVTPLGSNPTNRLSKCGNVTFAFRQPRPFFRQRSITFVCPTSESRQVSPIWSHNQWEWPEPGQTPNLVVMDGVVSRRHAEQQQQQQQQQEKETRLVEKTVRVRVCVCAESGRRLAIITIEIVS